MVAEHFNKPSETKAHTTTIIPGPCPLPTNPTAPAPCAVPDNPTAPATCAVPAIPPATAPCVVPARPAPAGTDVQTEIADPFSTHTRNNPQVTNVVTNWKQYNVDVPVLLLFLIPNPYREAYSYATFHLTFIDYID